MQSGNMQSIGRDLAFGLSLSALVFACTLAWGSPFITPAHAQDQQQAPPQQTQPDQPAQPDQSQDKVPSKTFTGTVEKAGEVYVLRDSSGKVFKLDDSDSARRYEGKAVKVIGQLDEQAMLIHVESIEGAAA